MKKAKKVLLLVLCAVLLVAGSVAGTLAYLTSQSQVKNTFTVGNVELGEPDPTDPNKMLQEGLDEAKVDEYGEVIDNDPDTDGVQETRVQGNTYKLIPGHTYTKDPTIHVSKDSEACWLFVKVENGIAGIEAAHRESGEDVEGYNTIKEQIRDNGWTLVDGTTNIYAYKETVKGDGTAATDVLVFNKFEIDSAKTVDDLKDYENAEIVVTAYAIQADGFNTSTDAWTALNGQLKIVEDSNSAA